MKNYAQGMYYNPKRERSPEFVLGSLSIKKAQLIEWLGTVKANETGYINLDILQGKKKPYICLNEYVRKNPSDDEFEL